MTGVQTCALPICCWGASVRFQVMSRRSLGHYQTKYPGIRSVEKMLHRRMTAILANSRAVCSELLEEGVRSDQLILLYNGVELPSLPSAASQQSRQRFLDAHLTPLLPRDGVCCHAHQYRELGLRQPELCSDLPKLCAGHGRDYTDCINPRQAAPRGGPATAGGPEG